MVIDFAMGPNQATGVPAPEGSEGLMWDIVAYNVSVPLGGAFDSVLPGWGTGTLQAAITGLETKSERLTTTEPGLPGDYPLSRTQITLVDSSLTDVTDRVEENGHLTVSFPSKSTGSNYRIFVIYLVHSDFRAQDGPLDLNGPQSDPTGKGIAANGSWAVDHFSSLGARTMTRFWEESILANGTRELVMDVGNYAWEDSVEIEANVYWTQNFSKLFEQEHGYSISKWLPLLFHRNGRYKQSNPSTWWVTDADDSGNSHLADYRSTVSAHEVALKT